MSVLVPPIQTATLSLAKLEDAEGSLSVLVTVLDNAQLAQAQIAFTSTTEARVRMQKLVQFLKVAEAVANENAATATRVAEEAALAALP